MLQHSDIEASHQWRRRVFLACMWGPTTLKGHFPAPITPAELPARNYEAVQCVLP
jgi:hypothetical protein